MIDTIKEQAIIPITVTVPIVVVIVLIITGIIIVTLIIKRSKYVYSMNDIGYNTSEGKRVSSPMDNPSYEARMPSRAIYDQPHSFSAVNKDCTETKVKSNVAYSKNQRSLKRCRVDNSVTTEVYSEVGNGKSDDYI